MASDHYTAPTLSNDGETADAADINDINNAVLAAFETLEAEIDSSSSNASAYATLAQGWAETAEDVVVPTQAAGSYSSLHYAAKASTSATAAGVSAGSANSSASSATSSASTASTASTNASNAQTAAESAQTAAETAQTAAELAETNAETAQTAAETAQTAAELAETNAAASAVTAASYDPTTTRGDLVFRNASNVYTRLPIGTAGQVLTSDGTDVAWGATSGQTAGDGLDLTGSTFSVDLKADGGLVIDTTEIKVDLSAGSMAGSLVDSYITSAATWNAKQNALTFGIANTNAVKIASASVNSGEYAKFTPSGLESKTAAEVKVDLTLTNVEDTALSTWAGTANITTTGTLTVGNATAIVDAATLTAAGKVELATSTETNTGTDATRAVTPDGLNDWTGSAQVVTVGTLSSGNATAIVDAATLTAAGKVELATSAEIDTGTDATRAVTPDGLQASKRNIRWLVFNLVSPELQCGVGTNIGGDFVSPIAGTIQQSDSAPFYIYATNSVAGITGTMVVDVLLGDPAGSPVSIFTTDYLDFDTTEKTTTTAATPPNVTTTNLAVGDIISFNIDSIHSGTAAYGLTVYMAVLED